jgi:hypothetical protein
MAWTPLYQLRSIEKMALNLLAIYDRDQFAALQWVSPELTPFRYFGNARRVDQSLFPVCFALPVRMSMTQSPDLAGVNMRQEITLEVANVGPDPEKLANEILGRARAVVMMTLSAQAADIFEGLEINHYGGLSWDVQEIAVNQFPRQNAQGQYLSVSQSLAVFTYLET